MNMFFLLAGSAALVALAVHVIIGGRLFVRPLFASDQLNQITCLTLYYCWHLTTLLIAAMAGFYLIAAAAPNQRLLAVLATALAAGTSLLGLLIVTLNRKRLLHMPQWIFFAIIMGIGIAGLTK